MPHAEVNGINLYYEVTGTGEPVVFIHGLGSSTRDWEYQVSEFAKSYRVVTFDLRGHGRSDKPKGRYHLATFAADAAALMKRLGIESAHVVGLSLGGCVAFQLAVDAPVAVKTLAIVNSAPELILRSFKEKLTIYMRFAIVWLSGMRTMGEILGKRLFIKPEQAALRQTFIERWAENDKRAYLAALRALIGWSVSAQLDTIRCPALIVSADQDYTPVALKEAYAAKMHQARVVTIADSRHATPLERPQELNRALGEFWKKLR